MSDATAEWPIPVSAEDTLRHMIRNCGLPARRRGSGVPRWSLVSRLTTHGSTYSAQLCLWAGHDPDELVVRRG